MFCRVFITAAVCLIGSQAHAGKNRFQVLDKGRTAIAKVKEAPGAYARHRTLTKQVKALRKHSKTYDDLYQSVFRPNLKANVKETTLWGLLTVFNVVNATISQTPWTKLVAGSAAGLTLLTGTVRVGSNAISGQQAARIATIGQAISDAGKRGNDAVRQLLTPELIRYYTEKTAPILKEAIANRKNAREDAALKNRQVRQLTRVMNIANHLLK